MTIQTQAQANEYWAAHEWRKWVVTFTAGPLRRRRREDAFVHSRTATDARRAGLADMVVRGHTWARSASVTVRLARAGDLGCVRTGVEGGAA